jgi:Lrp/AsnC family transcriptional regulator for asnA, asnC and gidA
MNAPSVVALDETDERIIALLRADGRMPYRAMAAELGLTEATVRTRVRRLEGANAMRVVAVTDFQAAGYELLLAVGIQVEERTPLEVAEELAAIPEVFSINLVIGTYDIEILVVAADQAALAELIYQRLATVPGVLRVAPALAVDVLKNQPDWVPLSNTTAQDPAPIDSGGASSPGAARTATAQDPAPIDSGGASSPGAAGTTSTRDAAAAGGGQGQSLPADSTPGERRL